MQSEAGASSHYHGYPNEWHGPKRKYDDSKRGKMGNHGGGIPKGSKNKKGLAKNREEEQSHVQHHFKVGDHVHVHTGLHAGVTGRVKQKLGKSYLHVVPYKGRAFTAHVKQVAHVGGMGPRVN